MFDWSEAVPIESLTCLHCDYHLYGLTETRCPECGRRFTWDEVLAGYHRRKHPLFEYHWRERPVYFYLRSFFRSLRPRKLWRGFDIHDPPAVKPLFVMAAVSVVVAALVLGVLLLLQLFIMFSRPGLRLLVDVGAILSLAAGNALAVGTLGILWSVASLGALMIFDQSMSRFKVRRSHVVRVWAYAVPLALPVVTGLIGGYVVVWTAIDAWLEWGRQWRRLGQQVLPIGGYALVGLWAIHVLRSIRHGYGTYLGMWHGWGIAIASQVIAVLATATIMVVIETL